MFTEEETRGLLDKQTALLENKVLKVLLFYL